MNYAIRIAWNTVLTTIALSITLIQLQDVQANSRNNFIQHSPQLIQLSTEQ